MGLIPGSLKKMDYYNKAGVNLNLADAIPSIVSELLKKNNMKSDNIGKFAAVSRFRDNYIALSTDGVGTKVEIARELNIYNTIGIDLVAMNVNDIICSGIEPNFFLDYIGFGFMNKKIFTSLMEGIIEGCKLANVALVGGESAQMQIVYKDRFDLVGFALGIGGKGVLLRGKIKKGDMIVGINSQGIHSNGYSLVNYLIKQKKLKLTEDLLSPTKIYVKEIKRLRKKITVKAMAHITGGGLPGNIKRIIPEGLNYKLFYNWEIPEIFKRIMASGVQKDEMFRVFNMGIGMVLIVDKKFQGAIPKKYKIIGEVI